jgi:hypothetical protein
MIAMAVLALIAIYIVLLVLAVVLPKSPRRRIFWILLVLSPVILETWDMPIGYWRFRSLCDAEGGVKIFAQNLKLAKIIRIQDYYGGSSVARDILASYPSVQAVESGDPKYGYAKAYARFERNPFSPIPETGPRDQFIPIITLIDEVDSSPGKSVSVARRGESLADYFIAEEFEYMPFRLTRHKQTIKSADGNLVATATWAYYKWTIDSNTLFGQGITSSCPQPLDTYKLQNELIELVAKRRLP